MQPRRDPRRPGRRGRCLVAVLVILLAPAIAGCSSTRPSVAPSPTVGFLTTTSSASPSPAASPSTGSAVSGSAASGAATSSPSVTAPASGAPPSTLPATPKATPTAPVAAVTVTHSVAFEGLRRQYVTVAPAGARRGLPLVVFLSGIDVSAGTEFQRDNLRSYVEASQLELVYPIGVAQRWNVGPGCCTKPGAPKADDAAFVRRVAALAGAGLGAAADRIYLAGFSGGGKLAWKIACGDPGPFAAVATYGAAPAEHCPATGRPLSAFIGFGDKDLFEPIAGSPTNARGAHPPAALNVATWRTRDGCAPTSHAAVIAGQITLQGWSDCAVPGLTVVYARWKDGTHALPGPSNVGRAAAFGPAAWAFLQSQRLSG